MSKLELIIIARGPPASGKTRVLSYIESMLQDLKDYKILRISRGSRPNRDDLEVDLEEIQ